MKLIVITIVCALVITVSSVPVPQQAVEVVEYVSENDGSGNFNFRYSLSDGTKQDETGELKDVQGEDGAVQAVVMTGSFEYVDTDGKTHKVTYTADENGFHPVVSS